MKIDGYLNSVIIKNGKYKKEFKRKENMNIECLFYDKLNIPFTSDNLTIYRDSFKGDSVKTWTNEMILSVKEKIHEFHKLDSQGVLVHDWYQYNHFLNTLPQGIEEVYLEKIKKLDTKLVPSHNDINSHNVIWNGKEIILIDFEWANMNHPLFDFVQLYISDGIDAFGNLKNQKDFNDLYFISLCFFLMWTYSMESSDFILEKRAKYLKNIKEINI